MPVSAIDHLDLVVTSLEQSLDFSGIGLHPLALAASTRPSEGDLLAVVRRLTARPERLERERG